MTELNQTLPLLPLTSGVVLPGMVFTMALETDEAKAAAEAAGSVGGELVLVPHIDGRYSSVGVISKILETGELPGGPVAVVVSGLRRATIGTAVPGTGQALWVQVDPVVEDPETPRALELAREYRAVLENILLTRGARRMAERLRDITDSSQIADLSGYSPDLSLAQKVEVLETVDLEARLRLVLGWARETLADLTLREQIKTNVEEGMEKTQREFLLRRQLEAIRKELNELDGSADEGSVDDYRSKTEGRDLPDAVRTAVLREVDKLERTSEQSPEHGWIRTWLDTVLELPWGVQSEDNLDVTAAAGILDEDHDGLNDVKERILEHLAVRKLRSDRGLVSTGPRGSGAILALVGPPGVGKTSLGESVARALGRKFVRVALGGVRDEAEIRGHRRTYVGAQPGRSGARPARGGDHESRDRAGRGRQARRRLSGRPVVGPARGARPRPEPHLPGPLPRGGARSVEGAVPGDCERGRDHSRPASRPHGGHPDRRLHRGREGHHRSAPPVAPPARENRAPVRRGGGLRRGAARHLRGLHARGRSAKPRA